MGFRRYPPEQLQKYPHYLERDHQLWDLFIYINPDSLEWVYYDVTVGGGRLPDEYPYKSILKNWKYLSSLKIDSVGEIGSIIHIYEVKNSASLSGIGQLLSYKILFPEDFRNGREIKLTLLCNEIHPDIYISCTKLNIRVLTPYDLEKIYPSKYSLYK
jgi:hypothetical protein